MLTILRAYTKPPIETFQTCACNPVPSSSRNSICRGLSLESNGPNFGPGIFGM